MRSLLLILISALLLAACSSDPALDLEGLEAKARSGDRIAIEQLVGLLAVDENDMGDRVYPILVSLGSDAVPLLLEQAASQNRLQREYVIAALGTLKVQAAIPVISQVLGEISLQRRYVAAWALGEIGTSDAVPPLIEALDDDNSEVRRYATRALIKLNKLSVEPLIAYLPSAASRGAAGAIRALGDIADASALEILLAQAAGENRGDAFLALGKLRDARAEKVLIAGLDDDVWQVRMNAAMALGPLGGPDAAVKLQVTLEDEIFVVREWSARSLEMITGETVLFRNAKGEYVRSYNVYH